MNKKIIAAAFSLLPSLAIAHPGHGGGFTAAFAHPFTGIDHLLMMLFVGVLAGRIGGNMRWQLPSLFLLAMLCGWLLGANGFVIPAIESGIAAGLIALGVLLAWQSQISRVAQFVIVAVFASLHGMAHGVELTYATPLLTTLGFVAATASLHLLGLALAAKLSPRHLMIYRFFGAVLALFGGGLLVAA